MITCPIDGTELLIGHELFYCPICKRFWKYTYPEGQPLGPLDLPKAGYPLREVIVPKPQDEDADRINPQFPE